MENLAGEIREQEAMARKIISEANVESANLLAAAQAEAEQLIKTGKQQSHRQWRENVAEAEKEADVEAEKIMTEGDNTAKGYYEERKNKVNEVAKWLVKEVVASYGSCKDE